MFSDVPSADHPWSLLVLPHAVQPTLQRQALPGGYPALFFAHPFSDARFDEQRISMVRNLVVAYYTILLYFTEARRSPGASVGAVA